MRLIDADGFIAHLEERANDEWNKKTSPYSWSYAIEMFMEAVEVQPTVNAVPREELLSILNGRLDFLKKWKDETSNFKKIAEAKIEDCEEIIDIIKSYE